MAKPKGPYLANVEAIESTGIDPLKGAPQLTNVLTIKKGLPYFSANVDCVLQKDIFKQLKIIDYIDHNNAYKWYNLPNGLTGQLIERILYYRGQGVFFYMSANDNFYFLPYTKGKNGELDVYGRFTWVTPVQFMGNEIETKDDKPKPFIQNMEKHAVYDILLELDIHDFEDSAVILKDYESGISDFIVSRSALQNSLLEIMSEAIPMARTSLLSSSGVVGVRVNDENQAEEILHASQGIKNAALTGNIWMPIVASTEFQELTNNNALKSEEFLLYLQALDSYRLSQYGIDTGGIFQKKAHMLESEQAMNSGRARLVYQSGLSLRQQFCDIVNSIWGLGISVEPSEGVIDADLNADGAIFDTQSEDNTDGIENEPQEAQNE